MTRDGDARRDSAVIPRLIHQTWRDRAPPAEMARLQRTWLELNPRWHHRLWTDADVRRLIERCAPWFLSAYDAYPEPIMRVDAFRYFLMFHVGGVYVDLDFECLRPIDELVRGGGVLVALEPDEHLAEPVVGASGLPRVVGNAFLASVPGHPFWPHVFAWLRKTRPQREPLEATGPFLLTRALDSWDGAPVSVAPARTVYPLAKRRVWSGALDEPGAGERLRKEGVFAVHHWMGTWVPTRETEGGDLAAEVPLHLVRGGLLVRSGTLREQDWTRSVGEAPLVSALMVTKDRPALAACSIECFRRQTWPARELVIVDDGADDALADRVRALDDPAIRHVRLPPEGLPLGTLRNRALAEARGELVCQWDDDDLFHPQRIALQVAALRALGGAACVLHRETLWWPLDGRVAVSRGRLWENSLLARRASLPRYPELRRGEDTPVIEALAAAGSLAVVDEPRLHVSLVHGGNTFPPAHFEQHWRAASVRRMGPEVRAWVRAHASSLLLERAMVALGAVAPGTDPSAAEPDPPARTGEARPSIHAWQGRIVLLGNGLPIEVDPRDLVSGWIARQGYWEAETVAFVERWLRPGMTVIDAGAHVGQYAMVASRRIGPGGRVHAFEPHPDLYPVLRRNLDRAGCRNVVAHPLALGSAHEERPFYLHPIDNLGASSLRASATNRDRPAVRVQVTTLDAYLAAHGVSRVDLLKIDVEGSERDLLAGAARTLAANPDVVLVIEFLRANARRFGHALEDLEDDLRAQGFRLFALSALGLAPYTRAGDLAVTVVAARHIATLLPGLPEPLAARLLMRLRDGAGRRPPRTAGRVKVRWTAGGE